MKTDTKKAKSVVPVVQVTKKTVFALKARPEMAEAGLQQAKFISAVCEEGVEKGKKINRIVKTVELEAKDGKGKPFVLTKVYNILPNGRGFSAFTTDINSWSGTELTEDDLYNERDYTAEFGGQALVVEVGHRKVGKEWEAYVIAFHPVGTEALAA